MDPSIVQPLLDEGLPGVVILILLWAYWQKSKRVDELQDQRIEDMRAGIEARDAHARTIEKLTSVVEPLVERRAR